MKKSIQKVFQKPWYPLLISLYPVLALYGNNVNETRPDVIIRPLLVFLAAGIAIFLVFRLLLRDWHRAAFVTVMWLILFSTYGHLIAYLKKEEIDLASNYVLGSWLLLAALFLFIASRKRTRFSSATSSLNLIAVVLLIYPLYQVISASVNHIEVTKNVSVASSMEDVDLVNKDKLPDVYYIILDSYTRADLMKQAYNFDNSTFISDLEKMGFYVARCSQSNYMRTDIALATTLNMDYLQNLSDTFKADTYNRTLLFEILKHSVVRKTLEDAGYKTVAYATGFPWSELDDADVFLSPSPLWNDMTDFEELLLNTTMARVLEDSGKIDAFQISSAHYRERTSEDFNSIPEVVKIPGPKFVFMHVISPHPPFVFGPDGQPTDPALFHNEDDKITSTMYAEGYTNQVTYINTRVEEAINTIINGSKIPPVIIIQGDHGPWMQSNNKRFWILNAYYLPGYSDQLYPTISPVNSFRIVLNDFLGTEYPLLADKSYFSPIPYIYDFAPSGNPCK
jgi:hypothetical protein